MAYNAIAEGAQPAAPGLIRDPILSAEWQVKAQEITESKGGYPEPGDPKLPIPT